MACDHKQAIARQYGRKERRLDREQRERERMQSIEKKIRLPVRPGVAVSPSSEVQARRLQDWQNSLVGKFIDGLIPTPAVTSDAVALLWNPTGSLLTIPHQGGSFVFKLSSSEDKDRIMAGGPYFVDGKLLALQPLPPGTPVGQVRFGRVPVWINLTGVPMDFCYPEVAIGLAEPAGLPTEADVIPPSHSGPGHVRVRVEIEAEELLLQGSYLDNCGGSMLWIGFEYEGIRRICRNCMFIGHLEAECPKSNIQAKYLLSRRLQAIASKLGIPVVNDPTTEAIFNPTRTRSSPISHSNYSGAIVPIPVGKAADSGMGRDERETPLPTEKVEDDADELFVLPLSSPGPDLSGLDFFDSSAFSGGPNFEPANQEPKGVLGKRKTRAEKLKK